MLGANLKICFAASEAVPLAKTGGLADVAGALPRELCRLGLDVRLFMPLYRQVTRSGLDLRPVESARKLLLVLGERSFGAVVWRASLPESELPVYLVDCPELFERPTIYTSDDDEGLRFAAFSRAVIETCQRLTWAPDIFHCHDWHTALIPPLLRTDYAWDALFAGAKTMLTVHNIGYQGIFPAEQQAELGLSNAGTALDPDELSGGRIGFLRTGLEQADLITTVSPTYAEEIQTAEYGMGLEAVLRRRRGDLVGILNGVDYDEWSPERDRFIPHRYSRSRPTPKSRNKGYLWDSLALAGDGSAPLIGIVSRLAEQKGFELCFGALPELMATYDLSLVVLGEGEARYVQFFRRLARRFPGRVGLRRGHDEELAHLIEAGADIFLMPSRYEPCGLNQMFSLRYGTIPVVRRTGGLADSVEPFDPLTGEGTGFVFDEFTPQALSRAMEQALETYRDGAAWRRLMSNAMSRDFSWKTQAGKYVELYERLIAR
jgi:starch synthase